MKPKIGFWFNPNSLLKLFIYFTWKTNCERRIDNTEHAYLICLFSTQGESIIIVTDLSVQIKSILIFLPKTNQATVLKLHSWIDLIVE